jgi:hypothetical protein
MSSLRIATLIPAFRQRFAGSALKCLARQTYRDFDCYLSDDSAGLEVMALADSLRSEGRINFALKTMPGPRVGLSLLNIRRLLSQVESDYDLIHIFFDDDLIQPSFYERHVALHQRTSVRVTASARYVVDESGRAIAKPDFPEQVLGAGKEEMVLTDRYLAKTIIPKMRNWVGEYSGMVFSRASLEHFGLLGWNSRHYGLADVSASIFADARLGYIKTPLGGFRVHGRSMTGDVENPSRKCGLLAWVEITSDAFGRGLISEQDARACVEIVRFHCAQDYPKSPDMNRFGSMFDEMLSGRPLVFSRFSEAWRNHISETFPALVLWGS